MNNDKIVDIKKIVGNKLDSGIYLIGEKSTLQVLDVNDRVLTRISLQDKLSILNYILDKMINNGLSEDLLRLSKLFDYIMDAKNREAEHYVNALYKKVVFLYSKPNIDIKEILSISDLVSNRLNTESSNNEFVKEELQKRLRYI